MFLQGTQYTGFHLRITYVWFNYTVIYESSLIAEANLC